MSTATFRIWRGDATGGEYEDYTTEVSEGMVVLDAVHQIQAAEANDMAVRWNCKAGKCGSCSAEVNGNPRLMCMTRLNSLPMDEPVTIEPIRSFPVVRDLVTDVSWNYEVKKRIKKFKPRSPDADDGTWRMAQEDVELVPSPAKEVTQAPVSSDGSDTVQFSYRYIHNFLRSRKLTGSHQVVSQIDI